MSAFVRVAPLTAARTEAPTAGVALDWRCPTCGKLRVFEGGRPSHQSECPECGSPFAATPRRVVATLDACLL